MPTLVGMATMTSQGNRMDDTVPASMWRGRALLGARRTRRRSYISAS